MKNILVPVGNTQNGINNLRYAVNFASMSGATVYLINLYKEYSKAGGMTKVTQLAIEDNREQLEEVLSQVDSKGVEVIAQPIKGDPFEGIARVSKQVGVDLIIMSPQSVDISDEVYLGNTTGKLVKKTDIPMLIVPPNYLFRKAENILLALKSTKLEDDQLLAPLLEISGLFSARINVLKVETPDVAGEPQQMEPGLKEVITTYTETKNATIYQGVLEHFQSSRPDILCVLRRKRGFFKKLMETNSVYKKDFFTSIPLLVLCGEQ